MRKCKGCYWEGRCEDIPTDEVCEYYDNGQDFTHEYKSECLERANEYNSMVDEMNGDA